jgi:hypothetical protein
VNDQFGVPDEFQELLGDHRQTRLIGEEFVGDAVHLDGPFVDGAIRAQVGVEPPLGLPPIPQFDAADFDDPMPLGGIKAGGFSIEYHLTFAHALRSVQTLLDLRRVIAARAS